MQSIWKQEEKITPPMKYFIEKALGTSDLKKFEAEAEAYVRCDESNSPPNAYFLQKIHPPGIIGPQMQAKILENKAVQALEYVKPYIEAYSLAKDCSSQFSMK